MDELLARFMRVLIHDEGVVGVLCVTLLVLTFLVCGTIIWGVAG